MKPDDAARCYARLVPRFRRIQLVEHVAGDCAIVIPRDQSLPAPGATAPTVEELLRDAEKVYLTLTEFEADYPRDALSANPKFERLRRSIRTKEERR